MSKHIPIFREETETYHADRCQELVRAVENGEITQETWVHGHYPGKPLPATFLRELKTVGYWSAKKPQSWGLDWHRNEGIEITYLESGTLDYSVGNGTFHRLKPGNLTITRPWQRHRLGNPHIGVNRLHWLIFDVGVRQPHQVWKWPNWLILTPNDLAELDNILRNNETPVWEAGKEIAACFDHLSKIADQEVDLRHGSRLTLLINDLFLNLLEMLRSQNPSLNDALSTSYRSVELFLDELAQDIIQLSRPWTLKSLAAACGVGATSFVSNCKRITNQTPNEFLVTQRLAFAAKYLESTEMTVNQIAEQCGFGSSQYFATVFQKKYEMPPIQWRHVAKSAGNSPKD